VTLTPLLLGVTDFRQLQAHVQIIVAAYVQLIGTTAAQTGTHTHISLLSTHVKECKWSQLVVAADVLPICTTATYTSTHVKRV
jgi:hypothetical protein